MGYQEVEQCIIKPHERYLPKAGYPSRLVICHHQSYLDIAREIAQDGSPLVEDPTWVHKRNFRTLVRYKGVPIVIDNSRDNAEETFTHLTEHYFWGADSRQRYMINISSAGGVNPDLKLGDFVVGQRAIRDNRSTWNMASPDTEAVSDSNLTQQLWDAITLRSPSSFRLARGDVWSNATMYYTWERLQQILKEGKYDPQCVETEMEALCIGAGWLNHNYRERYGPLAIANLFYLSDVLPSSPHGKWLDTMNNMELLRPYKRQVLIWALELLAAQNTQ